MNRGRKPGLISDGTLIEVPRAPTWLSVAAKAEWRRVMPDLIERRILTDADLGSVENYCIVIGRVRELEQAIQADLINLPLLRAQDKAAQTARQLAAELGLTPVSRSRPSIRTKQNEDDKQHLSDLGL